VFGLLNVVVFTGCSAGRIGIYVIGNSLAAILGAVLFTWLKQAVLREEAKADGTDIRGTILLGFLLSCLTFPVLYLVASCFVGMDGRAIAASIVLALCVGFFELGQELLRRGCRPACSCGRPWCGPCWCRSLAPWRA